MRYVKADEVDKTIEGASRLTEGPDQKFPRCAFRGCVRLQRGNSIHLRLSWSVVQAPPRGQPQMVGLFVR